LIQSTFLLTADHKNSLLLFDFQPWIHWGTLGESKSIYINMRVEWFTWSHPICTSFISGLEFPFWLTKLLKRQGERDSQLNQSTCSAPIFWQDLKQRPPAVPPDICSGFVQCILLDYLFKELTSSTADQVTHECQWLHIRREAGCIVSVKGQGSDVLRVLLFWTFYHWNQ
jgi:hypothetical protein